MAIAGAESAVFPRSRPYPQPAHALSSFDEALQSAFPGTVLPMPSARSSRPGHGRPPCCANGGCSNCPLGAKFEVALHLADVYEDPRVDLRLGAEAKGLRIEAGVVKGMEYERGGRMELARGDFVGLGAHALFNPYLCQRSGLEGPAMGRFLHEQVSVDVNLLLNGLDNFDGGQQVSGYGTMFYDHDRRREWAGCNLELWNLPWLRAERGRWRQRALIKFVFETEPQFENRVYATPEHDKPIIEHAAKCNWSERAMRRVPRLVEELAERIPIEDVSIGEAGTGEAHIQGTTRMSLRPEDGVVDPDLVHHTTRNLALLGSGAFPSCPSANPTLILSALSIRSARRLFGGGAT
jgi:choline dehydrogenase-like flavoprotein